MWCASGEAVVPMLNSKYWPVGSINKAQCCDDPNVLLVGTLTFAIPFALVLGVPKVPESIDVGVTPSPTVEYRVPFKVKFVSVGEAAPLTW